MSLLRTVVFEHRVDEAIRRALVRWPVAGQIVRAIEWTLARDPLFGEELDHERGIRGFVYPGAVSIGEPDVDVIYEVHRRSVVILDMIFSEPDARYAGRA